jgi:hypothetical protein
MTTIHSPGPARHRRATDRPEVHDVDSWLDPETSPLAVYADRDLPFAPVAVQRDRAVTASRAAGAAPAPAGIPRRLPAAAPARCGAGRPAASVPAVPAALGGGLRVWRTRTVVGLAAALVLVVAVLALVLGGAPSAGPGGGPGPGSVLTTGGR